MGNIILDNSLEIKKAPLNRTLHNIYTERISDKTLKSRTKTVFLSTAIIYLNYSDVKLVQLGWLKFTGTTSPLPLLYIALIYFSLYFIFGAILDYKKFKLCRKFDVWDEWEKGVSFIQNKINDSSINEQLSTAIVKWIENINMEYSKATQATLLQRLFYWGYEISLPICLTVLSFYKFL